MQCGVGDYTALLAEALGGAGATVAVLTSRPGSAPVAGVEVFPVADRWTFAEARTVIAAIRAWKPEVVHFQFPTQGYAYRYMPFLLPLALRALRFRIVETWHEYQSAFMPRYVANALIDFGIVVVRPRYLENMSGWFRWMLRRKLLRFIPNASPIRTVLLSQDERARVRDDYGVGDGERLIVSFGFVYAAKGVDLLFEILDPGRDRLIIASDLDASNPYQKSILERLGSDPWRGHAVAAGFLRPGELARLLAAADAVVLPFREGGGGWNTSIHAVLAQGTFLLTTSAERNGYDEPTNVYYARPLDVAEMRGALATHGGRRCVPSIDVDEEWRSIARQHLEVYDAVLARRD